MAESVMSNDWEGAERREYTRYSLDFYVRVYDARSGELLGDVVDISLGGMRLSSPAPIAVDKRFRLRMDLALAVMSSPVRRLSASAPSQQPVRAGHTRMMTTTSAAMAAKRIGQWTREHRERVCLEAQSVWGGAGPTPDVYETGFAFVGVTPEVTAAIQHLIDGLVATID